MTPTELQKLTREEKRAKIAAAVFHKNYIYFEGGFFELFSDHCPQPFDRLYPRGGWLIRMSLPDYLNDLNACFEMERRFESVDAVMERREYVRNLAAIVQVETNMDRWSFIQDFILLHATAAQRADAFLLTINPTP